ncbi:MAG: TM0106 family RecB-like putative nuclease [Candidatus Obscuribacterales bacterium]
MYKDATGRLIYSPSDLIVFMESEFASWMDRYSREAPEQTEFSRDETDAALELLQKMGIEHERKYLEQLRAADNDICVIDATNSTTFAHAAAQTIEAMHAGREIIYQGALQLDNFAGRSDFLIKVAGASKLGDYHYQVWDTKLSRKAKPYFLIQLCCYAEMLDYIQGVLPEHIGIILGDVSEKRFRTQDYIYYYRQLKQTFLEAQANFDPRLMPIPNGMADHRRWQSEADKILEERDHLSRVANIRSTQIKKLEAAGITTMTELATTNAPTPRKMEETTYATLQTQARLQIESAQLVVPKFELLPIDPANPRRGLALLPPASPNDVFFDMEGYPYVDGGLEYLFGASYHHQPTGHLLFRPFWGHTHEDEKRAFEKFIDWVYALWQTDKSMHIYHYADYEISALRRLMGRHASREQEVDDLLRNEVFVNLFAVVRQGMQVGTPSYSIKKIEQLYRPKRDTDVANAVDSIIFYQKWLEEPDGTDVETSLTLQQIQDYNRDDCDSTAQLADWLRNAQKQNNIAYEAPKERNSNQSAAAAARGEAAELAEAILNNLPEADDDGDGDDDDELSEGTRIARMLAYLLEFHWREEKPLHWAVFERRDMTTTQLTDDINCLGGLSRTKRAPRPEKKSQVYEYSFDPSQDTKFDVDKKCLWFENGERRKGTIFSLDEDQGFVEIKIGPKQGVPPAELNLLPDEFVSAQKIADSIFRTVSRWHKTGHLPPAIDDFLRRNRPRVNDGGTGPILKTTIIDAVRNLQSSTLCIQGPPGSGKTYSGSKIIIDLLRAGKKIGVTSNSHKAIAKLLSEVDRDAKAAKLSFAGVKIQSDDEDFHLEGTVFDAESSASEVFAGGGRSRYDLIGGTAWAFSDETAVGALDYLFVDEAGQVSVANLVGMAPSTKNIILMGDQMQLSQPTKGAHPEDSGQSSLQYLLQDKQTIPADFGIFLSKSYRMHPDVCSFISSAVYEGRLEAEARTAQREILVPSGCGIGKSTGIVYVPVEHEGNNQGSDEEAAVIGELIAELLKCKLRCEDGAVRPIKPTDILVVAPYNMQVRILKNHHVRTHVGTVDKFQGQEAPIVIVSMCASDGNESARGLEFLFSKNRLNVAISRAQCLAFVVGNPRLGQTACSRVEQMEMINLFCRLTQIAPNERDYFAVDSARTYCGPAGAT